ncbi:MULTISPECIES: glycoside hydrolase family 97 protein [unclassified Leeuwenhoekiella]|uniref:glycoside hydrolase family 97 protein n=1 Tax=unclassified Leeuwenhoekiella TaxID=2615029 RepID=UPI000C660F4E|nr:MULTISPECIES: glycoside hydrolase family 97 protein [unclassified Leeuwenhoekiella]MAW95428.1 alpha-glucosidase [Leeuwenhoekiella sp.]MBA80815.1 alpha-glucosidase [Leeuwenhoekiella sp.]|tara:strand:- start:1558 stop:3501 length:1944 start_codon:yes stop_codon:yes gene_type:complete
MKKSILFLISVLFVNLASAQNYEVVSPKGDLELSISIGDEILYTVQKNGNTVLENNTLALTISGRTLGEKPKVKRSKKIKANVERQPTVPLKFSVLNDHYEGIRIDFKGNYSVEFRVFDEGVAYRFITDFKGAIEVESEDFTVNLADEFTAHLQQTPWFKTSYEYPYSHIKTSEFKAGSHKSTLPVLLESDSFNVLISESDLTDYPAMFLNTEKPNQLSGEFPLYPLEFGDDGDRSVKIVKEADYIAKTSGKRAFPWRYFLITTDDKDILTNTLTTKLAQPNALGDLEWLKPGQVSWEWWNGASPYNVDFKAGFNEETYKYFIDFASKFDIPYIIMDEGWAKTTTDPYTPNPDIDLFKLIEYGKERDVKIVLWLTWLTVENNFELFEKFQEWGIAGVKIDFMDRSDQWMVNYYERVAKEAAKHKLFVDFHGSFKPAGLEIKYPNILSYEGVLGLEQMERATTDNSLYLPFIRNAVGPMDFTPGGMINMQPEIYYSRRPNSAAMGTRAYQMALFVVFESGLQMLADNPTNYYNNEECTQFITSVPTTWDETVVLDAKIGEYVVVAKRKGDVWYTGAITNNSKEEREFEISLDFLDKTGKYEMTSFEDGINAGRQGLDYKMIKNSVDSKQSMKIRLVRNGGWAAVFKPQ